MEELGRRHHHEEERSGEPAERDELALDARPSTPLRRA